MESCQTANSEHVYMHKEIQICATLQMITSMQQYYKKKIKKSETHFFQTSF